MKHLKIAYSFDVQYYFVDSDREIVPIEQTDFTDVAVAVVSDQDFDYIDKIDAAGFGVPIMVIMPGGEKMPSQYVDKVDCVITEEMVNKSRCIETAERLASNYEQHDPAINIGAYVLTQASYELFGSIGVWFLAVMVVITCFTTSVGLITSVAEFFSQEFPIISYKQYVTICSLVSLAVANLGLNQIIKVSLPMLLFLYPIAISVVVLIIVNKFLLLSRIGMRITVAVAASIAVIDILNQFAHVAWAHSFISM